MDTFKDKERLDSLLVRQAARPGPSGTSPRQRQQPDEPRIMAVRACGGCSGDRGAQGFESVSTVLCLGAHSDDIEIGCGGTLLKLRRLNPRLKVKFVVFSGDDSRAGEARRSARHLAGNGNGVELMVHSFRDGYFPYEGARIKDYFNELADRSGRT